METLMRFMSVLAVATFFAACGTPDNSIDNTDTVAQVTTDIPSSGQIMASNPVALPSDDNQSDGVGVIRQELYAGPGLKLPLPAGYKWKVNTSIGDAGDKWHTDAENGYFSLDFGRYVQDNNGRETTIADVEGNGIDANGNRNGLQIDVLAAAAGKIVSVTRTDCYNGGDSAHTCKIIIDHGNGYTTKYLHFKSDTIPVAFVPDYPVAQGQFLGKMGNTGDSGGAHVHFQVLHNGKCLSTTQELIGITLDDKPFTAYEVGKYFLSTNGFTYDPQNGSNPRTCKNGLTLVNGDYTCDQQSAFQTARPIFSDLRIDVVQKDACFNVEYWRNGQYYTGMSRGCTNGAAGNSWYIFAPTFYGKPGNYEVRYFVSTKDRLAFLPAPMAVAKFTVLDQSNQPAPTITIPKNWTGQKGPNAYLEWSDAPPWDVTDHDLIFWVWEKQNVWGLNRLAWFRYGSITAWAPSQVIVTNLPMNKWIAWQVRSCGPAGCSRYSSFSYFALVP